MFDTLFRLVPADPDFPPRTRILDFLTRVLEGRMYDDLPYEFHEERGPGGEYIPLRQRKPSIRYNLSRLVVEDAAALVFSAGHFPEVIADPPALSAPLARLIAEARLNEVMLEAAIRGAVGSVALHLGLLKGRLFVRVLPTLYLTPRFDPAEPDRLIEVRERYKVTGAALAAEGYEGVDPARLYWFERRFDTEGEWRALPWPVGEAGPRALDAARSLRHGLGFVPIVWIRNLPGPSVTGAPYDGASTFRPAIETQIEIDYQLSQAGRGLKYSADPTLLIKEPATPEGPFIKSPANALVVSEKGDAKLLEIGGTAAEAVITYVRTLRELALEQIHGNRANADRFSATTSGRALEMMNQGLIWLADNLRITYGEGGLLPLLGCVLEAARRVPLKVGGEILRPPPGPVHLRLAWPHWFPAGSEDRARDAASLTTLYRAGLLSRARAVAATGLHFPLGNLAAELAALGEAEGGAD
jgi:hypothetical protein